MASLFAEMHILDRPYIPMQVEVRGSKVDIEVRLPSGQEQDLIDAFYMNTYATLLAQKCQRQEGEALSQRESYQAIYESKTRVDLLDQILPTRNSDTTDRASNLAGIDRVSEIRKMNQMDESVAHAYAEQLDGRVQEFYDEALKQISSEYDQHTVEMLAQLMSDININIKVTVAARKAMNADVLYYTMYRPLKGSETESNRVRAFDSVQELQEQFRSETIDIIMAQINEAMRKHEDIPFVSREDKEPAGQPPSLSTLGEGITTGGKPTKTMRGNSKRSSTPVS